jgi:hypothetical protein
MGVAAAGFPNYLIYFGPFGPYAHGSALPVAEAYTTYFLQMIEKMQVENVRTFTPSVQATRDFGEHHDLFMKRTVWHGPCSAWYTVPPYATTKPDGRYRLVLSLLLHQSILNFSVVQARRHYYTPAPGFICSRTWLGPGLRIGSTRGSL